MNAHQPARRSTPHLALGVQLADPQRQSGEALPTNAFRTRLDREDFVQPEQFFSDGKELLDFRGGPERVAGVAGETTDLWRLAARALSLHGRSDETLIGLTKATRLYYLAVC